MATATAAPPLAAVDRRENLSAAEFIRDYRTPNRPVIFTDLSRDWPALGRFSPQFFREQFGDREVEIAGQTYRLGEFFDLLERSTADHPAPYPCKLDLRRPDFTELAADVPRPALADPDRSESRLLQRFFEYLDTLEVFIGGPGGEFPYLHYDYLGLYAFINQLYGEKEFVIYPPGQEECLYVDEEHPWRSRVDNVFHADLEQFPLFAQAQPVVEVLKPGETLFIPCGWWHTARSRTVSISVAFDQLCASNWRFFTDEVVRIRARGNPKKAALLRAYLGAVGAMCAVRERLRGQW